VDGFDVWGPPKAIMMLRNLVSSLQKSPMAFGSRITKLLRKYVCIYDVCVLTISEAWVCFVFRSCLVYIESVAIVDGFDVWGPLKATMMPQNLVSSFRRRWTKQP